MVAGASATLVRQPDGASFTFTGTGLTAGNAPTMWFVAFKRGDPPLLRSAMS